MGQEKLEARKTFGNGDENPKHQAQALFGGIILKQQSSQ